MLVAILALAACGPVRSTSALVDAAAEVSAARTAGAHKAAPYEYIAAEAFLHKAREEQGHADYELAVALAQRSAACARAAIARMERQAPIDPTVEPLPDPRCRPLRSSSQGVTEQVGPREPADPVEPKDPPEPADRSRSSEPKKPATAPPEAEPKKPPPAATPPIEAPPPTSAPTEEPS